MVDAYYIKPLVSYLLSFPWVSPSPASPSVCEVFRSPIFTFYSLITPIPPFDIFPLALALSVVIKPEESPSKTQAIKRASHEETEEVLGVSTPTFIFTLTSVTTSRNVSTVSTTPCSRVTLSDGTSPSRPFRLCVFAVLKRNEKTNKSPSQKSTCTPTGLGTGLRSGSTGGSDLPPA